MVSLTGIKVCQYKTLTLINQHLNEWHYLGQKVVLSKVKDSCIMV